MGSMLKKITNNKLFYLVIMIYMIVNLSNKNFAIGFEKIDDNWYYKNKDNEYEKEVIKKSGDDKYYLDENGKVVVNYFLEDYNDDTYFFDNAGKMVKDTWVAIDPNLVEDKNDNNELAYWYYFQNNGKAIKANDEGIKKIVIDGKGYVFNEKGQLQTGFISENGSINLNEEDYPYKEAIYYADVYGVLKKGWIKYSIGVDDDRYEDKEELYLYFNEKNYKKVFADGEKFKQKIINGKKYLFDENGIMLSAWDYYDEYHNSTESNTKRYYGQESDGAMMKNGWVYTVPSEYMDKKDYSDEIARYFYFNNSGIMVRETQKKIDGKYYAFDKNGIMKTGLVVFYNGKYENYIDIDYTSVEMLAKYGTYYSSEEASNMNKQTFIDINDSGYTIQYFDENGERKNGKNNVEFVDDTAIFVTTNKGALCGEKKKRYYSNGILLKAKSDCKYGVIVEDDKNARECYEWRNEGNDDYSIYYYDSNGDLKAVKLLLLDTNGKKKKKGIYKDKDDNYWVVNEKNIVQNVFNIKVKEKMLDGILTYMYENGNGEYLFFDEYNMIYKNYCENHNIEYDESMIGEYKMSITNNMSYQVKPEDDYILNFTLE